MQKEQEKNPAEKIIPVRRHYPKDREKLQQLTGAKTWEQTWMEIGPAESWARRAAKG